MSKRFRRAFTELKSEAMCKFCLVGHVSLSSGADHRVMVANNSNSNNSNMAVVVNKRWGQREQICSIRLLFDPDSVNLMRNSNSKFSGNQQHKEQRRSFKLWPITKSHSVETIILWKRFKDIFSCKKKQTLWSSCELLRELKNCMELHSSS